MLQAILVKIGIMQVRGIWIKDNLAIFFLSGTDGLLVPDGLAHAAFGPVISASGNGQDHFFARDPGANLVQYLVNPALVGKVAGVAAFVVLINRHHEQKIVHFSKSFQLVGFIVRNYVLRYQETLGM